MLPFFSVIVPVYNKRDYVAHALQSVLEQSFEDFEIIVVCDPSTDGSEKEVERLANSRIRVAYRDEPGPGGYAARNLGIRMARGRWLTFLDADDEWYPAHLHEAAACIRRHDGISVFTSAREISRGGRTRRDLASLHINKREAVLTFGDYLSLAYYHEPPFHPNTVVVRNVPESIVFFPEGKVTRSGDLYAWVYLAHKAKRFVWSAHVAGLQKKGIEGVTSSALPGIDIYHEMVNDLRHDTDGEEARALKRYANKLIRVAWLERRQHGKKVPFLAARMYWSAAPLYCFRWSVISLLPLAVIIRLRRIWLSVVR